MLRGHARKDLQDWLPKSLRQEGTYGTCDRGIREGKDPPMDLSEREQ
jgi:hypothetical protein